MDPRFLEAVFAPAFLLMGLSHLFQPQLWVRFFEAVRNTGLAAVIIPLYTLPVGLVLIAGHNQWSLDIDLVYTIAGWAMTIKSAAYLLIPGLANRVLEKKMARSHPSFQIVGAAMAMLGAVLTLRGFCF